MTQHVYALDSNDLRNSDRVLLRDLVPHLQETARLSLGYAEDQQAYDAMVDAPAKIDDGYAGWPWHLSLEHPALGVIGVEEAADLGHVAAVMKMVLDDPTGDPFAPHPEAFDIPATPGEVNLNRRY